MSAAHTPVLIVGGGIVGLSASLFLSFQSIPHILIERHAGTSIHPRGRSVNIRTMELYRNLGIDEAVREAGAALGPSMGIYKGSTLFSAISPNKRKGTVQGNQGPMSVFGDLLEGVSSTAGARGTQDFVEPVLVNAARERGGDVRFHTECVGLEQDDEGVTTTILNRDTGVKSKIHADYVIAADGAGSPIRQKLGVKSNGKGTLGHLLNILFHADLAEFVRGREFSICMTERPEVIGMFTSINNSDRWVFHLSYDPAKGEKPEDFTPERCQNLLRIALGMPDVEIDVKSILPWEPSERVVEKLQNGRVFLAGDAAHTMTPYGGQGANSGIADVHNLAWKLAAVMKGTADTRLLETYDVERLPVGRNAAAMSAAMADERGLVIVRGKLMMLWNMAPRFPMLAGYGYEYSSPAILTEAASSSWFWWCSVPWTLPSLILGLNGRPGTRAPHVLVRNEGKQISTLDLFGQDFVVIAGSDGKPWCKTAPEVASRLGVGLKAYRAGPTGDLSDTKRLWEYTAGISAQGAVLIRPDGFVAWRVQDHPLDAEKVLEDVLKRVLGRHT